MHSTPSASPHATFTSQHQPAGRCSPDATPTTPTLPHAPHAPTPLRRTPRSINQPLFSANMLAVVAYNPMSLLAYAQLGECADMSFVDVSEYAAVGEMVSFWELMRRAQQQVRGSGG